VTWCSRALTSTSKDMVARSTSGNKAREARGSSISNISNEGPTKNRSNVSLTRLTVQLVRVELLMNLA
jgi:hypothetical protein